jgi:hypothetical protein
VPGAKTRGHDGDVRVKSGDDQWQSLSELTHGLNGRLTRSQWKHEHLGEC